jgi:triacylglycerol lipase
MNEMDPGLRNRLRDVGAVVSPKAAQASMALIAPCFPAGFGQGVHITQDLAYGRDPAQRLDVIRPLHVGSGRAALVFVHGGGYVGGDKSERAPFYRNIGIWAARHDVVTFNINYRVAPAHPWPAAVDDVASALSWIATHAQDHGIDERRITVLGHSAGATHVASSIAMAVRTGAPLTAAAVVFASGIYDLRQIALTPNRVAYFGDDRSLLAERSSHEAIAACGLPVFIAVAENDAAENVMQALDLARAIVTQCGVSPAFMRVSGHNHFSTMLHLGAFDSPFSRELADFISTP